MAKGSLAPIRRIHGDTAELTDEALVAACAVDDEAALGALYDRYHLLVFRVLSRVAASTGDEIDDLVQMTFLEVWKSAAKFRKEGQVRSWIVRIGINVARHYIRGEVRRRRAHEGYALMPVSPTAVPDDQVAGSQLVARVWSTLGQLSHERRTAFVLCELEGFSGPEAAEIMKVRPGTIWRRVHEARKALRSALQEEAKRG